MMDMIGTITGIVRQYMPEPDRVVTEDSLLKEDLGLDSFDIMHIIMACEDALGTRISGEVIGDFITVKDIRRVFLKNNRGSDQDQ